MDNGVGSLQKCEEHKNYSNQSNSESCPSFISLQQKRQVEKKKYQCSVCTKTFIRADSLSQHMLLHDGIRKYECNICNKSFTYSRNLHQHKKMHAGIKKYQCDVCNKSFTLSYSCLLYTSRCV